VSSPQATKAKSAIKQAAKIKKILEVVFIHPPSRKIAIFAAKTWTRKSPKPSWP
jgi:hypothetical protein